MPQPVTPVANTWPSSFTTAADGDLVNGADCLAEMQDYANALQYLKDRGEGVKAYTRLVQMAPAVASFFAFTAIGGPTSTAMGWSQTTSGGILTVPLLLPEGNTLAKITGLNVAFHPKVAGRAGLPATQPSVKIWKQIGDGSAGRVQVGPTATLASGSVVAYEAPQTLNIAVGGGGEVINNSYQYYAEFSGESDGGANFQAGLLVPWMRVTSSPS